MHLRFSMDAFMGRNKKYERNVARIRGNCKKIEDI